MVYTPAPKEKEDPGQSQIRKTSNVSIPSSAVGSIASNAMLMQQSPTNAMATDPSVGASQPSTRVTSSQSASPSPHSMTNASALSTGLFNALNPSPTIAPLSASGGIANTANNNNSNSANVANLSADSVDLYHMAMTSSSNDDAMTPAKLPPLASLTSTGRRSRHNSNVGLFGTGTGSGKMPRPLPFLVTMRNKLDRHYCSNNFSKVRNRFYYCSFIVCVLFFLTLRRWRTN
jgi:hypothetical protein